MKANDNPLTKIYQDKKVKEDFKKFDKVFEQKTYYERYKALANWSHYLSYFFNILSIAGGTLGVASILASVFYPNLYVMALPAFVLLVISELIKRKLLHGAIVEKMERNIISYWSITFNILLVLFSGYATVMGGIEIVNIARGKSKPIPRSTKPVSKKYKELVAIERLNLMKLEKENTWQGNTYYNKKDKELKYSLLTKIDKLQNEEKKEIAKIQANNKTLSDIHNSGTNGLIIKFLIVSIIIELLCVITIIYPIHYKHKSRKDKNTVVSHFIPNQEHIRKLALNMGIDINQLILNAMTQQPEQIQQTQVFTNSTQQQNPIGFRQNQNLGNGNTLKRPPRGKTINYTKVYKLLDEGLSVTEVAIALKCSESSVRTAKRKRKNGNPIA